MGVSIGLTARGNRAPVISYRVALLIALLGVGCDHFQVIEGHCYGTSRPEKSGLHVFYKKSLPLIDDTDLWPINGVFLRTQGRVDEQPRPIKERAEWIDETRGQFYAWFLSNPGTDSWMEFSKPGYRPEQGTVTVGEERVLYVVLYRPGPELPRPSKVDK